MLSNVAVVMFFDFESYARMVYFAIFDGVGVDKLDAGSFSILGFGVAASDVFTAGEVAAAEETAVDSCTDDANEAVFGGNSLAFAAGTGAG